MRTLSLAVLALASLLPTEASTDIARLRRLMTDSRFVQIISPCKTGGTNRQNAAEWLRTAFHDAASHDEAAGIGGIDASIRYETGYSENAGIAFPSTMTQYRFYQNEGVSLADIVALGATVSVGSCGGPMVPYRGGRVDAWNAAPQGFLPKPQEATETHIQKFARMGFSATEAITLVACGHTLGAVHNNINPTLTSEPRTPFDDTPSEFDNNVAINHMNGTGRYPLNQPYDPAFPERSSDTRLFASDGNKTISEYANSNEAFKDACNVVLAKLLNEAVPSSVSLTEPLEPFPVAATFVMSLRNERYGVQIGSAQLYDMAGQWQSFEIGYTNRDGSPGTDSTLISLRELKTLSIGKPVEVKNFLTPNGIPPETGIGSFVIKVTMNDGSVYSSAEGEEVIAIDDSIIIDGGPAYTCNYTGEANNFAQGLNVTMAVLGPYNAADKVEVVLLNERGDKRTVAASYRRARDATYNYYGAFIADVGTSNTWSYGAKITRADGSVSVDDRQGGWYRMNLVSNCLADAEVPTPQPVPSGSLGRRSRKDKLECRYGLTACEGRCVDTREDIENCGGCAGRGGVDCTALSNEYTACIQGKCVRPYDNF